MKFATVRRWVFNLAAAVSLVGCLASAALWARSLGHFEMVHVVHNRWRQADDLQLYTLSLAWYPRTLRLSVDLEQCGPEFFDSFDSDVVPEYRKLFPAGSRWEFYSGFIHVAEMIGNRTGFHADHHSLRPLVARDGYTLGVRPFLPTLLAAILPAVWLIQDRRRRGTLWQFGLRELLLSVTAVATLLGAALWLMR